MSKQYDIPLNGKKMAKVLIATLYHPDPVLVASNRLGPDRLILLIDHKPDKEQAKSLKLIQQSIGRVVDVKTIKTEVYDIVRVAEEGVKIIDMQPKDDEIFVNITSGRKTKAMGLLFAAYARCDKVKKIAYNPYEDPNAVVWLPKLSFKLTESQKSVLNALAEEDYSKKSLKELADIIGISRAMLYRNIDEMRDMGYISTEKKLVLTDAGRIARL